MAKHNDAQHGPPPEVSHLPDRHLTVSLYPEPNPHVPWIRLHGLWLRQAGFTPKSRVRVRVMPGCLVITKE